MRESSATKKFGRDQLLERGATRPRGLRHIIAGEIAGPWAKFGGIGAMVSNLAHFSWGCQRSKTWEQLPGSGALNARLGFV